MTNRERIRVLKGIRDRYLILEENMAGSGHGLDLLKKRNRGFELGD